MGLRKIFIDFFLLLLVSWPIGLYKMFIDFWSICVSKERSKTFLVASSNLSGEEFLLPRTAAKTSERFQVPGFKYKALIIIIFDNRSQIQSSFSDLRNKQWQRTSLLRSRIQVLERLLKPQALKWLQKRSAKSQAFALAWRIICMRSCSEARLRNFVHFFLHASK